MSPPNRMRSSSGSCASSALYIELRFQIHLDKRVYHGPSESLRKDMFSAIPKMGTLSLLNISTPRIAS